MHQLRENTGNGLISELAQTPHCSVVTACHYHKHRLTLVHAHTSSHKLPCNCAYISTHNSKYRIHLKYVHASFPYLSLSFLFLSLIFSSLRHTVLLRCDHLKLQQFLELVLSTFQQWNQHWDYTSLRCSCFPPRQQTECFECCCHVVHQACLLPPNLT